MYLPWWDWAKLSFAVKKPLSTTLFQGMQVHFMVITLFLPPFIVRPKNKFFNPLLNPNNITQSIIFFDEIRCSFNCLRTFWHLNLVGGMFISWLFIAAHYFDDSYLNWIFCKAAVVLSSQKKEACGFTTTCRFH